MKSAVVFLKKLQVPDQMGFLFHRFLQELCVGFLGGPDGRVAQNLAEQEYVHSVIDTHYGKGMPGNVHGVREWKPERHSIPLHIVVLSFVLSIVLTLLSTGCDRMR